MVAAVDGKTLSGAAYTAGKGLFSDLVLPTISKVTSAMDRIEQELQTYTNADQNISSEGMLDEDKLNQQIATKKAMKASVDASAAVARALSRSNPVAKVLDALLDVQNNLNRMSNTFEEDIRELQKKVEKLHQFSSQTNSLFASSLNDMHIAMQGVLVLNNTVVNRDGTYQLPTGVDSSWFNQLKEKNLNEDKQPDVGDREYRLIDLGYGKMWMWVKKGKTSATAADIDVTLAYNKWLSRMIDKYGLSFIQGDRQKGVDELFYEQNATLIKELATGIDSVTGKKLTQAEMLGKASLLANSMITIGVMVKGVINVGKTQNAKRRNTNKKASGAGTEIGKHSVETLNRDQTRTVVENLLDNGEISLKDLQNMVPEGTPNTFKPTDTMKNGAKYEFQLSDGQKAIIRWHEPDLVAAAKFPNSSSGSRWTAQIKIGNKQVTVDGLWTKKQNLNEVHVPIQGR
ncbi:hypothetical protein RV12_GL002061 [Enterococcus quebecensis]|nr:hypothetical protein RV12_GL002061 [Enterococcus quebecensis]